MNVSLDAALQKLARMVDGVVALLPNVLAAAVVLTAFWFGSRLAARAVKAVVERARRPANVGFVLARLTRWGLMTLGAFVAVIIVVPSLNAGSLVGALGIGGVAIGFAFKDIFQNLLAGLLLLVTRPFVIGDQIVSGGHEGTVEDIQIRATLLRTYDHRLVLIPNSELYTNRVVVNTARDKRRASVEVGIGYGDDIDRAKRIILEQLAQIEMIERDPAPSVVATALADFDVKLEVRFWVGPPRRSDLVAARDQVITRVKSALMAAGIDLPFPTQQVLFHDQTEDGDGDRKRQREGWPARGDDRPQA